MMMMGICAFCVHNIYILYSLKFIRLFQSDIGFRYVLCLMSYALCLDMPYAFIL